MKKNIYLLQINKAYNNNIYLPYSVGSLAACAFANETVSENYCLKELLYRYEDPDVIVSGFEKPYLVGFSSYLWNTQYNLRVAKLLKEKYPECIVLFGGHNVPSGNADMMEEYPFIDFIIHDEGEVPFREFLLALHENTPLCNVPNLSYRDENGKIRSNEKKYFDVTELPSPYLEGYFDKMIEESDFRFQAIFETNRGCPYGCAYCDWGIFKTKLRQFPVERVYAELDWLAEHKIEYCISADSNFGILKRDTDIAKYLVEVKRKTGYPGSVCICFAKNCNDTVFEINKILYEGGIVKNAMLSVQTLNEEALKNIGRENLVFDQYEELSNRYKSEKIPVLSELILGLPGETYDSFCDGLCRLITLGQHMYVNVYCCDVLLNSEMGTKEYKEKHSVVTTRMPMYQFHADAVSEEFTEYSDIVTSTATLSTDDWINANIFHAVVTGFHGLGILQNFAVYLLKEKGVSHKQFYTSLFEYITSHGNYEIKKLFDRIRNVYEGLLSGKGDWGFIIDGLGSTVWPVNETVFLEIIKNPDLFFEEIGEFLSSFGIEEDVFENLLIYQKEMLKTPGLKGKTVELDYDFYTYFSNIASDDYKPLMKKKVALDISCPSNPEDFFEYARINIWYGRRRGLMLCFNDTTVREI